MPNSDRLDYHSELPGFLGSIDNLFSKIEAIMLATGVLLMALNTCINVVARFVFGEGLFFAGEINRILIILITFAGIGFAARLGRHIRMSAFFDMLPDKGRKFVMIVVSIVTAVIMFALAYFSFQYVVSVYERGRILPALGFEIWWIYIWVPLGFAITGLQYLLTAYKNLISKEVYLSSSVVDGYADHEHDL
ncbi:MAG TPA: C4-dicarboxylate ABC transporter permease [Vibrio sp.]|uniref:TRAP transporter small permease n=1 Tax=Vibrio TaxID=662 RepID=UPI000EE69DF4|nr:MULTISPECIES: TRAP transporter small permease [Vibrio]HCH00531.1 C4-dicarboxylate ABC transporter permease [Vibrio sp.]